MEFNSGIKGLNAISTEGFYSFLQYIQKKTGHDHFPRNSLVLAIHISLPFSYYTLSSNESRCVVVYTPASVSTPGSATSHRH
jgi:hypothetical protein